MRNVSGVGVAQFGCPGKYCVERQQVMDPGRDAPKQSGPHKTICNCFIRWSRLGVFNTIFAALATRLSHRFRSTESARYRVSRNSLSSVQFPWTRPNPGLHFIPRCLTDLASDMMA